MATDFKPLISSVTGLFDDVVGGNCRTVRNIQKLVVYACSSCTSGGVRTKDGRETDIKMLGFRMLDWGMDVLGRLIVQLEFVNEQGGCVVARNITYIGYVGVLMGVRLVCDEIEGMR